MNTKFKKNKVDDITIEVLQEAIQYAYNGGHSSHAALGCSGDTFILHGESRRRQISVRLYSGDVELLVTDNAGTFLFYGRYSTSFLAISFIAEQYYGIISNTKHLLSNTSRNKKISQKDSKKMLKSGKALTSPLASKVVIK